MTNLHLKNDTAHPVTAYITLGATSGCVQDVASITLSNGVVMNKLYPLMGNFVLPAHSSTELTAPAGNGFNGNFSFNTPPLNCPTHEFPDGVNLGEFIINNGFQANGQETVDISCVAGVNCALEIELSTDDWNNGCGAMVKTIKNGTKLDNTNRDGVYPYGCDNCISSDNPPSCVGKQPHLANKQPICNVQRPAGSNLGGSVTVIFKGFEEVL